MVFLFNRENEAKDKEKDKDKMSYQKLVVDEVSGTPLQEMTKPTHEKLDETEQPLLSSSEAPAYQVRIQRLHDQICIFT